MGLRIFDSKTKRLMGWHPDESDDPVRVSGNRDAIGLVGPKLSGNEARFGRLNTAGNDIEIDVSAKATHEMKSGVDPRLTAGLLFILLRVVRKLVAGEALTVREQAMLDSLDQHDPRITSTEKLLGRADVQASAAQLKTRIEAL